MKKAKLRATRIPDAKLLLGITTTRNALQKNAAQFSDAAAMIAQLEAVLEPYAEATRALAEAKSELKHRASAKNAKRKLAECAWGIVAYRVEAQARKNPPLLHAAGLPVTNDPRPVVMTQVLGLRLTPSRNEGEILARWKPIRRARAYQVQICAAEDTAPTHWRFYRTCTKTRCALNQGLESGRKVWVRVRAFGASGLGPWSNPARLTVP
ncbi:MAG: hypothetical protein PCFJNLEI_04048 [Verrucomicrobiae bacterium]|nr:hypothetical protein [Verrucomicrobiae bacterium]